ncbi:MAG: DNA repair protein RecN [Actinobacteria bacterium]|nr:DNA repair protein RecN [Actinomycetota bacterium]
MIDELHIRGLGVIEDVTLRLAPGLTVITGETGAGKTMVVTALGLLLGDRADSSLVRAGGERALAEARISPPPASAAAWLDGEDELVVSREIPADGRSRARINGRLAPVSALQEVLGSAVEVHAQHEHVRLARPDVQRGLLDRFAGDPHARTLAAYRDAYGRLREARDALTGLEADARERARSIDRLTFELEEIERAELDADRDGSLDAQLDVLEHAEELQLAVAEARTALGEDGAAEPLGVAVAALRRTAGVDDPELEELRQRAVGLTAEVTELAADLRAYGEGIDVDPSSLDGLRARQQLIGNLRRKYGDDVAAVIAYGERAAAELFALQDADADAAELEQRVDALTAEATALAADVSRGRAVAAERLAEAVDGHLADLGMPHARFAAEVATHPDGELHPDGADRVTFTLTANPGEPARPLATAASGGERSRVALAVEVALADVNDAAVLVFDEVDAGIGGATALAVGEKLARLASAAGGGRQVVCVTHLAQLAAFADVHHVVEKGLRGGRTVTTTRAVDEDQRPAELSRMLGGDATREAGIDHARELLAEASRRRAG